MSRDAGMSRREKVRKYFHEEMDEIVSVFYGPEAEKDAFLLFIRLHRLYGVMYCASFMGDLDQDYFRVYRDMMRELYDHVCEKGGLLKEQKVSW